MKVSYITIVMWGEKNFSGRDMACERKRREMLDQRGETPAKTVDGQNTVRSKEVGSNRMRGNDPGPWLSEDIDSGGENSYRIMRPYDKGKSNIQFMAKALTICEIKGLDCLNPTKPWLALQKWYFSK